jgi:formamidopyrimidine-DNA glycosylase
VPELPEVETVRARLAPVLDGRRIERAAILDPRLTRPFDPTLVAAELQGERVGSVGRRGKYLIVRFASGRALLVHLRMTGSFRVAGRGALGDDRHRRAVLTLDDESDVAYRDVRRFGTWEVLGRGELEDSLAERLGPEPLSRFPSAVLAERLEGRRTTLKAALLDQRMLAGLGNIYVDEALWRARLHPRRGAGSLAEPEVRALHRAIRQTLRRGIERQGASLRDYADPEGRAGSMQDEFRVYGREGAPCERCGAPIAKIRVAGRGTWLCPRCQAAPA